MILVYFITKRFNYYNLRKKYILSKFERTI